MTFRYAPKPDESPVYQALPEFVRCQVPQEEWAWLSDAEKARLETDLTEPEA